jgi:ferredoxin-NADP reductase
VTPITPARLETVVSHIHEETPSTKTFRLDLPGEASFIFEPGQFVLVSLPDEPEKARAFSIVSSPHETSFIEITVEAYEDVSRRLCSLKGGETLFVTPPQGKWKYRDEDRYAAFVTRGSGLAPFRSMIRYAIAKGLPNRIDLFYEAKTPDAIPYRRELQEYADQGVGVHLSLTQNNGNPELEDEAPWEGETGEWTVPKIRKLLPEFKKTAFYFCGSGKQIDAIVPKLLKNGIPEERVRAEKWGDY